MDSRRIEMSTPINIPIRINTTQKKQIENKNVEYLLTENNFDPAKASPPNEWAIRLSKRIDEYSHSKTAFNCYAPLNNSCKE